MILKSKKKQAHFFLLDFGLSLFVVRWYFTYATVKAKEFRAATLYKKFPCFAMKSIGYVWNHKFLPLVAIPYNWLIWLMIPCISFPVP